MILLIGTTLTGTYSLAMLETELPPKLRAMRDSLFEEVAILRGIEDRPLQYHTENDRDNYRKWKEIATIAARNIVREFPYYKDEVMKLTKTVSGLKDIELPE